LDTPCLCDLTPQAVLQFPAPAGVAQGGLTCPTGEQCCQRTKYNLYPNNQVQTDAITVAQNGQCFDPTKNEQCCSTGQRFNAGWQQCCVVSGVQSLEQPCPCSTNAHCATTSDPAAQPLCCTNPLPSFQFTGADADRCDQFSQYPSSQYRSSPVVQGCRGTCIDQRYQTCCFGVTCVTQYERCCNATCCNRFVGTCKYARKSGAPGFPSNAGEGFYFQQPTGGPIESLYWQCSVVEHLDTVKGFLLFALPAILLASSLSALGLALIFANKSSPRRYSFLERTLILFAVLSVFLILPVFFSPLYKYAEVVVLASVVAIITAAIRVRWLNIFAIVILAVTVIYIFDPFYGNAFLTLAYNRQFSGINGQTVGTNLIPNPPVVNGQPDLIGEPDVETSGILHATAQMHMNSSYTLSIASCTTFYDYFTVDQSLLDLDRRDLKENVTFGYCSRAYIIALLFFEGFASIFVLLQLIVALLAIIVRFRKQKFDPIELEVMAVPVDD